MLLIIGIAFSVIGIVNIKGNISTVHSYNRRKVTEEDVPTHMVLQFTSSHGGAYIGSPGNSLWIDNVKLVY